MLETAAATADAKAAEAERNLTDGWHLVIEALKLNGVTTIYAVPGIPITDLGRLAQAAGLRVISFRHEQNAGNAAAIAGFRVRKPGICLTVSAPGFLNGLNALANATTNCFPMILISGSSEREIVDLQQGDYEEMDQLAIAKPLSKAAFRVLHAADIGIGVARAIRAAAQVASILICRPNFSLRQSTRTLEQSHSSRWSTRHRPRFPLRPPSGVRSIS
jgi:oxalyl-CoA decarboxylase